MARETDQSLRQVAAARRLRRRHESACCRVETLSNVVRTGLASVTVESMLTSDKTIEIVRVKITEAGRLEIPKPARPP